MTAYAARTGTRRNLAALKAHGWRLMISARGKLRTEGFAYALDNGAWTAFQEWQRGTRASAEPCLASFRRAVSLLGAGADFVVVPDIVLGGARSLAMSRAWLRRLRRDHRLKRARLLIAVQNGMVAADVERFLCARVGLFVGGDTEWKLATMAGWSRLAHARGAICHVGRVNTARRIRQCDIAGADSFDGSGPARFLDTLSRAVAGLAQPDLEGLLNRRPTELAA